MRLCISLGCFFRGPVKLGSVALRGYHSPRLGEALTGTKPYAIGDGENPAELLPTRLVSRFFLRLRPHLIHLRAKIPRH